MEAYETAIVIVAAAAATILMLVISRRFIADSHEVYDPGNGSIKIRCPSTIDDIILHGYQKPLTCPICGTRLAPPTKKNMWQRR